MSIGIKSDEVFFDEISKISFSACSNDSALGAKSYPEVVMSEPAWISERLRAFSSITFA